MDHSWSKLISELAPWTYLCDSFLLRGSTCMLPSVSASRASFCGRWSMGTCKKKYHVPSWSTTKGILWRTWTAKNWVPFPLFSFLDFLANLRPRPAFHPRTPAPHIGCVGHLWSMRSEKQSFLVYFQNQGTQRCPVRFSKVPCAEQRKRSKRASRPAPQKQGKRTGWHICHRCAIGRLCSTECRELQLQELFLNLFLTMTQLHSSCKEGASIGRRCRALPPIITIELHFLGRCAPTGSRWKRQQLYTFFQAA